MNEDVVVPLTPCERLGFFRRHLLADIIPFWPRYALDRRTGALRTCIADDGTIVSGDIYMWSQLRAIYTFSALYNRIERRKKWLEIARGLFDFCRRFGRDENGDWCFRLSAEGKILAGATSVFADGFALFGLCEYYRATEDEEALRLAIGTYDSVQRRLAAPGSYATDPYPIPPGAKAHAISMVFSFGFDELGRISQRPDILAAGLEHARLVMNSFRRADSGLVLEYLTLDGDVLPTPQGRIVIPGHAIECMWFMIHIFRQYGDREMIDLALECIRRHLEFGWDQEYGGLFLSRDSEGTESAWPNWDKKLWWAHAEALYALTLAGELSSDRWIDEWYAKIHTYAFERYPVRSHGEWIQTLDRKGRKITDTIALPVKDPFHLPRALILSIESLQRQLAEATDHGSNASRASE